MQKKVLSTSIILSLCAHFAFATGLTPEQTKALRMAKQYQTLANKYQKIADEYQAKVTPNQPSLQKTKQTTLAQSTPAKPQAPAYNEWEGTNASAGGTYNTGNSGGSNFTGGFLLSYQPTPAKEHGWLFTLNSAYQYAQTAADGSTANRFVMTQKTNYMFNEYNGVFGNIVYTNDKFDTFKYQTQENIGYTRLLFKNPKMSLILNAGPGFLQTRNAQTNQFKNAPSWFTLLTYSWAISPDTVFTQTAQNTTASTNTNTLLVSAITTTLYKKLALQTSFQWAYDSKADTDRKSVNTLTKLSLVYNF